MTDDQTSVDLTDLLDDPFPNAIADLLRLVDAYPLDLAEGVAQVLDDLSLICATRADPAPREAAQFLAAVRRLLRAAAQRVHPDPTPPQKD